MKKMLLFSAIFFMALGANAGGNSTSDDMSGSFKSNGAKKKKAGKSKGISASTAGTSKGNSSKGTSNSKNDANPSSFDSSSSAFGSAKTKKKKAGTGNGVSASTAGTSKGNSSKGTSKGNSSKGTSKGNSSKGTSGNKKYSVAEQEIIIDQAALFVATGDAEADFVQFYSNFDNTFYYTDNGQDLAYTPEFVAVNITAALEKYTK